MLNKTKKIKTSNGFDLFYLTVLPGDGNPDPSRKFSVPLLKY